jgi:predicted ATP-dependent endonuclease of OLD family
MQLVRAEVGPFKSIEKSGKVSIDAAVTVLVGINEAGKTAFLQALNKSNSIEPSTKFDPVEDYPRKDLTSYLKKHATEPEVVTKLAYQLDAPEIAGIKAETGIELPKQFTFTVSHKYDNAQIVDVPVNEKPVIAELLKSPGLSTDARSALDGVTRLRDVPAKLAAVKLTQEDGEFKARVETRIGATQWDNVLSFEVWSKLNSMIPKFLYFDDYYTLPGKVNLNDLTQRAAQEVQNPAMLEPSHRAMLALLRMADIQLSDLTNPAGYETIKAKLEGISNSITDQVFKFWKQNESLEVEFDIRADAKETQPPFNNGANLYIRIRNKRHRVTVPFDKRSKGFIWFFSFLVWFDSVQQQQSGAAKRAELVLLLDEPGLSLHALAQNDFLGYIDELAKKHQVIYTTHSPFMVRSDRLLQVRVVEDRDLQGTLISDNISGFDRKTLFPLQAALGYSIAQNLFIGRRNLIIEGPSDLIYLPFFSSRLEDERGVSLRSDIVLVPAGGLDKVATFIALFVGNQLELTVLHDSTGKADPRIAALVEQQLIAQRSVLTYAHFRDVTPSIRKRGTFVPPVRKTLKEPYPATDIEDLLGIDMYLDLFNDAFAARLGSKKAKESDLPPGDRIIGRLGEWLANEGISLRKKGGFNHYAVASHLASNPVKKVDDATLDRFHVLIDTVNGLFSQALAGE